MSRPRYKMPEEYRKPFESWVAPTGHVITSEVQQMAAFCTAVAGKAGVTGMGLARTLDPGDEGALSRWSPALSHLHKEGVVVRVDETREGHAVYVLPEYADGRDEVPRHLHHCQGCDGSDR